MEGPWSTTLVEEGIYFFVCGVKTHCAARDHLINKYYYFIYLFIPREGPWHNVIELGDDEPSYVECSLTVDQTEVKF